MPERTTPAPALTSAPGPTLPSTGSLQARPRARLALLAVIGVLAHGYRRRLVDRDRRPTGLVRSLVRDRLRDLHGWSRPLASDRRVVPGTATCRTVSDRARRHPLSAVLMYLLFPFRYLGPALWSAIPAAIVIWAVVRHRPALWAVALIALCLAWPYTPAKFVFGNPVIWGAAALRGRDLPPLAGCAPALKPTILPFALFGIRDRRWWLAVAILGSPRCRSWLRHPALSGGAPERPDEPDRRPRRSVLLDHRVPAAVHPAPGLARPTPRDREPSHRTLGAPTSAAGAAADG